MIKPVRARDRGTDCHAPVPAVRVFDATRAFRADIEGLRGIAVLLVVAFHAGVPGFTGGYVGVDVFFVLSGYLITGLLVKEVETTGKVDLVRFYARRARRLLPASALMLAVTVLLSLVLLSPLEQRTIARTAAATAVYASNVFFMWGFSDYFADAMEANPLLHTWSLAVEEQFYLVWPVLILLALRLSRSRRAFVAVLLGISVLSFAAAAWAAVARQPWAFFGSPLRAWEFAIGGAAAMIPPAALTARRGWSEIAGWLGLLAVLACTVLYTAFTVFPGVSALPPVLGTTAALLAGAGAPGRGIGRMLCAPALQRLGQLSYSWYLWHWPALVFGAAVVPEISLWTRILLCVGALGLAAVAHHWVENPIRFHPRLSARPALSLSLTLWLTLGGIGVAAAWLRAADRAAAGPRHGPFQVAAGDVEKTVAQNCFPRASQAGIVECQFGDTASARTIVLFGDSHASHWLPAIEQIAVERRLRLVTLLRASCPAADVSVFLHKQRRNYPECDEWRGQALRRIVEIRPEAAFVSNFTNYVDQERVSTQEWHAGTRRTFAALNAAGVRTWFLRDPPRPHSDVPSCLSRAAMLFRGSWITEECTLRRSRALAPEVFEAERRAGSGLPLVGFLDLTEQFCGPQTCDVVRGETVVYRDANHLSASFARSLAPALAERIWIGAR